MKTNFILSIRIGLFVIDKVDMINESISRQAKPETVSILKEFVMQNSVAAADYFLGGFAFFLHADLCFDEVMFASKLVCLFN